VARPDVHNPRTVVALLGSALTGGFLLALVLTSPPAAERADPGAPEMPAAPSLPEPGAGQALARSILARAPWGGRLAELADSSSDSRRAGANVADAETPEALARRVARWRYLGGVRRADAITAVFLDDNGELVHLAVGDAPGDGLVLSVLEDDHVVFETMDNTRSIRLQLFGQTALELERVDAPEVEDSKAPGENG